jgi:hypothetical protein
MHSISIPPSYLTLVATRPEKIIASIFFLSEFAFMTELSLTEASSSSS